MAQQFIDSVRDQVKSAVARLDGTVLEQPIATANKTILAGIGLADQVRSGFETRFNALVADGEKVRDRAQASMDDWREEVSDNAKTARTNVAKRANAAFERLLSYSPVATTGDVRELNEKLLHDDRVDLALTTIGDGLTLALKR